LPILTATLNVVSNIVKEQFVSKSQPISISIYVFAVVSNIVKEQFVSKSQLQYIRFTKSVSCFKYHQRTICKQITTEVTRQIADLELFQISQGCRSRGDGWGVDSLYFSAHIELNNSNQINVQPENEINRK